MANARLFSFVGGSQGLWRMTQTKTIFGEPLLPITHLSIVSHEIDPLQMGARWVLQGITSNERYVTQAEKADLSQKQESLGRSEALCGALIPIRKKPEWWT